MNLQLKNLWTRLLPLSFIFLFAAGLQTVFATTDPQQEIGEGVTQEQEIVEMKSLGNKKIVPINQSSISTTVGELKKWFEEDRNDWAGYFEEQGHDKEDKNDSRSNEIMVTGAKALAKDIVEHHPQAAQQLIKLEKHWKDKYLQGKSGLKGLEFVAYRFMYFGTWPNTKEETSALYQAAQNQFGLTQSKTDNIGSAGKYKKDIPNIGMMLDSMKNITEDFFTKQGISHITLYRGVVLDEKWEEGMVKHQLRALSSFTSSKQEAVDYSLNTDSTKNAYVLVKNFPIERVLSLNATGLGVCPNEFVVLGPQSDVDDFYAMPIKYAESEKVENKKSKKKSCVIL